MCHCFITNEREMTVCKQNDTRPRALPGSHFIVCLSIFFIVILASKVTQSLLDFVILFIEEEFSLLS